MIEKLSSGCNKSCREIKQQTINKLDLIKNAVEQEEEAWNNVTKKLENAEKVLKEISKFVLEYLDNLSWNKNTQSIVKESNKRMIFLHKAAQFTKNLDDLKRIYIMQVRSKLEQSAVLWHFGLSEKNRVKLERVQKSALKVILGKRYTTYSDALKRLNIESLEDKRKSLCLKFAKKCLRIEKLKKLFPKNVKKKHKVEERL